MYSVLINDTDKIEPDLLKAISDILNHGYTYEEIRKEIVNAFNRHEMFPFYKFRQIKECNLLKQGVRYYHKELNLMSKLKPVHHDIDSGTITSENDEYWIEPRASYTIQDLINYMYSKNMVDTTEFPPNRMQGLMRSMVKQYGLEIILYMIEHAARMHESEHEMFTLRKFDTYNSIARQYFEEVKNNCVYSGGAEYVPRKRMLFD